ncbi:GMC family oxidoreductase [Azospirillum sp. sgz301742]
MSADAADQAFLGITFPPGYEYPMPALPDTLVDQYVAAGVDGLKVDGQTVNVTVTPAGCNSRSYQHRRACGGNTNGIPICPIQAKYDPSINGLYTRQFRMAFLVEQPLPRPQIACSLSDYTKGGFESARRTADRLFEAMGTEQATDKTPAASPTTFTYNGQSDQYYGAGHVVGTCRMGADPADSVVGPDLRSWDHDNLYILGSSTFPTVATANPTLTIAALTLRAAEGIKARLAG